MVCNTPTAATVAIKTIKKVGYEAACTLTS
jgi:hypothetical protein